MPDRGYQEFAHTADWGIHVWAGDLASLLRTAAEGMFDLLEIDSVKQESQSVEFEISHESSLEVLLVDFLNELLFLAERDRMGFDRYELTLSERRLSVTASGGRLLSQSKEIKAVTFHNLEVVETDRGLEAKIIFDV